MPKKFANDLCNIPVFEKMNAADCCGCEVCVNICPKKIISLKADAYGFRYPSMNPSQCIHCLKCVQVCPALSPAVDLCEIREIYAGYVCDEEIVLSSSSGGFFSVLANSFLKRPNAQVAAVVWSADFRSTHHICGGADALERMKGSKYIQSRKNNIYQEVQSRLNQNMYILFVGCPCEIAGLKSYLGKNTKNLYCIDFVCKGPTSEKPMKEYADIMEKRFHSKISSLNLRYVGGKAWIPQWIRIQFENGKEYLKSFYRTPLGNAFQMMQRPSCHHCKYAGNQRQADLTLGDFHNVDETKTYYNPNGTSIVLVNTRKGKELFQGLTSLAKLQPVEYEDIIRTNPKILGVGGPQRGAEKFCQYYIKYGLLRAVHKSFSLKNWLPFIVPHRIRAWRTKYKNKF